MAGKPNPWLVIAKLVGALVVTGLLGAGLLLPVVGGIGLAADDQAKNFLDAKCNVTETQPPRETKLYASDGKTLIARIFDQDRQPVKYDQIPDFLREALVATEDRRFYSHHGVDMRGLIRSAINTSSGDTQGGSTLTMQYVKQIRYYQAGSNIQKQQEAIAQNLQRKIEDAKCALNLEKHESKQDILTNYLNIAFFGENSYGIESAAETYFNHTTEQLTLPEAAMLVGLLQAPTAYDPFQYPDAARERRNQVLQNLVDVGQLSQVDANKYAATPVQLATTKPPEVREGCSNAPDTVLNVGFFCQYAVDWLLNTHTLSESQLKTGGYNIVTTLNAKLQNSVQKGLSATIPATSPMTAVLPIVDPRSGNVLAMASSKNFGQATSTKDNTHTTLPIFTSYAAQGASTYKLFPLLTALSAGVPDSWPLQTPVSGEYTTKNCVTESTAKNGDADEYFAPGANETLETATQKSSNTFFVGLADQLFQCNLNPMVDLATKLGMNGLLQPSDVKRQNIAQTVEILGRAQQFVLGDIPTSPLQLTGAYGVVANGGKYNAPAPIIRITDYTGQHQVNVPRSPEVTVVSPQAAATAVQILKGDTDSYVGTSASKFQSWYAAGGSPVAGKTGTSAASDSHGRETDENASLWFVGMTPDLVATTALINFDRTSAPAAGLPGVSDPAHNAYGAYAAGVWLKSLQGSLKNQHWSWPSPEDVPGNDIPSVIGQPLSDAEAQLKDEGYHVALLGGTNSGLLCASTVPYGMVAYYGPNRAEKGATVTLCASLGRQQDVYHKPSPTPHPSTSSGSSSSSSSSPPGAPPPTQTAVTSPRRHHPGGGNGGRPGGG